MGARLDQDAEGEAVTDIDKGAVDGCSNGTGNGCSEGIIE